MLEPRRIRPLEESVVSGIAAGEVIERPASAVKELVENALDAGASVVDVLYDDRERIDITVVDDGHGMGAEDLPLALQRHATSKLSTLDELARIATFGFRGEALASMAAVSTIEIVSRRAEAEAGAALRSVGGRVVDRYVAASRVGTRVSLTDVFGDVPARKKFLKAPGAEFAAAADTLRRFALLHPGVHFRLLRNGRSALDLPGVKSLEQRLRQVLDEPIVAGMHPVDARHGGMILTGVLTAAGESFGSARRVFLFVNGRWVQDRLFFRAVMEGYRTYLMRGRYPAAALFLDLPGDRVDVNVHPAKLEVRFADGPGVERFVGEAVRDTLRTHASPLGRWGLQDSDLLRSEVEARRRATPRRTPRSAEAADAGVAEADFAIPGYVSGDRGGRDAELAGGEREASQAAFAPELERPLRIIGQTFRGYILCEAAGDAEELVLIDQHAAHERVLYERLVARLENGDVESQQLLTGLTVSVGGAAAEAVESSAAALRAAGWEIERLGDEDVVVRAVPALVAGRDVAVLVERLAAELARGDASGAGTAVVREVLASVACHAATRVGQSLSAAEQRALIDEIASVDFAASCPHGRPVARTLTRARIERMFGR